MEDQVTNPSDQRSVEQPTLSGSARNRQARPGPLTTESIKSIRSTLRKHRDLTAYVSKVVECQDDKLLDSLFITLVRLCIKDKLTIFITSTPSTIMTYAHVKPGIYSIVTYITKSTIPNLSANFSYNEFFGIDPSIDVSSQPELVNVQYINSDYDLLVKQRTSQADGKVLCPLTRRSPTQQQGIALTPTKQLILEFLISHGITDPIGRVISRTGQFIKEPNTNTLTSEQIDIVKNLAEFFKTKPGSRITIKKLNTVAFNQPAEIGCTANSRVPLNHTPPDQLTRLQAILDSIPLAVNV